MERYFLSSEQLEKQSNPECVQAASKIGVLSCRGFRQEWWPCMSLTISTCHLPIKNSQ